MRIRFNHTKCFDWETVKPADVKDGDVTGSNAKGEMTRRISIDSPYTDTQFAGGAVDAIHSERAEAELSTKSDYQVMARHIEDAVVPLHFNLADVTSVECDEDPKLATFLTDYFNIKSKVKKTTEEKV